MLIACSFYSLTVHFAFGNPGSADTSKHFFSMIDRSQFDTLRGTDFTWAIFKPINDTISLIRFRNRDAFVLKLSHGQKALFYIWTLEQAVVDRHLGAYNKDLAFLSESAGFSNFYYNYKEYFSGITNGLRLINDTAMLHVMLRDNSIYLSNKKIILNKYQSGDWNYIKKKFYSSDQEYLKCHEHTMNLLESYIRIHVNEFVRFK